MQPSPQLILENFMTLKRNPVPISNQSSPFPTPNFPALGNHSSAVCLWLCLFWTVRMNGIILLCLTSFPYRSVLKVHPCYGVERCFLPCHCQTNSIVWTYPVVSVLSSLSARLLWAAIWIVSTSWLWEWCCYEHLYTSI